MKRKNTDKSFFSLDSGDSTYIRLRDDPGLLAHRTFFEEMYKFYFPQFADRNFSEAIADHFHPPFWEMYLTYTMKEQGHNIIPRIELGAQRGEGPDVCLKTAQGKVWIEAIAPSAGVEKIKNEKNPNLVPTPLVPTPREINDEYDKFLHGTAIADDELEDIEDNINEFDEVPRREVILRYTYSLYVKLNKAYKKYINESVIEKEQPFIVAINGGDIPFFESSLYLRNSEIPLVVQATLGVSDDTVVSDTKSGQTISEGVLQQDNVPKLNGDGSSKPVSTSAFDLNEYVGISGALYSSADAFWSYDRQGREFVYIHNHNANQKLPKGWLRFGREYWKEENTICWKVAGHKEIHSRRIIQF